MPESNSKLILKAYSNKYMLKNIFRQEIRIQTQKTKCFIF